jgi:hypothetical protein
MANFTGTRIRRETLAGGVSVEYYSPEYVEWLEGEIERLRDWMQRVTDAVVDWRTKVTGDPGSGCPIDAVVVLAALLRKREAEIQRLRKVIKCLLIAWHDSNPDVGMGWGMAQADKEWDAIMRGERGWWSKYLREN